MINTGLARCLKNSPNRHLPLFQTKIEVKIELHFESNNSVILCHFTRTKFVIIFPVFEISQISQFSAFWFRLVTVWLWFGLCLVCVWLRGGSVRKGKYKKEKYITEREGKQGVSFQICIPFNSDGKRKYYTETIKAWRFPSDKVAFDFAKKRRDMALLNLTAPAPKRSVPTVSELFERNFELSGTSLENYNRTKSLFKSSLERFGDTPLSELSAADIQSVLVEYAETHTQPCVNRVHSIWRKLYETAQMDEYDVANKMLAVHKPKARKVIKKRSTDTSKHDFDTFCNALLESSFLNKEIHWYILQIMYYTGMRPSEVFALSGDDIDFEHSTISVTKAVGSTSSSRREIIRVKADDSIRTVPIVPELKSILLKCMPKNPSDLLFTERDGNPIDIKHFSHDISIVSERCGIPFNSYRLRHLFSTDLFAQNENPVTIKALMGHSSIKMSAYYANATEQDKEAALQNRQNVQSVGEKVGKN